MRLRRRSLLFSLAAATLWSNPSSGWASTRGMSADTVGVNTHIGQGQPWAKVAECLMQLGLRHIRDSAPTPASFGAFVNVVKAGARLTAVVNGNRPLAASIAALEAFERAAPGALAAIEGPNEVNNFAMAYGGANGTPAAIAFQNDLYRMVKQSAILGRLPVIAFTDARTSDCLADFFAFHPYPPQGRPLSDRLPLLERRAAATATPDRPIQLTEFGYSTAEVSEQQQAALLVRGCRDAIASGVRRIFLYQLADFYRDPTPDGTKIASHYGLFDFQYRPKPSVAAIRQALAR